MKKQIPYVVAFFLTLFIGCQTDDAILESDALHLSIQQDQKEIRLEDTLQNRGFSSAPFLTPEAIELERIMQWVSYITADVLFNDEVARNAFINELYSASSSMKPFILLNDVLGNEVHDQDPFKAAFRNSYKNILLEIYQITNIECPGGATERPPTGSNGGNGSPVFIDTFNQRSISIQDINALVEEFMNYIITEECLEIYFPKGITNSSEYASITSTAHPLIARATESLGYKRYITQIICGDVNEIVYQDVNRAYINSTDGPVVLVRPTRFSPNQTSCEYTAYNFDFTTFMN
ncbi:hypothetical protein ACFO3O_04230 [Dokdonia ponticola]|uniref:Lipoprotein n=1 Tax=Dokdonia ponticola TaxID=2041041 RepID=A0ABV9HT26_9FLAO